MQIFKAAIIALALCLSQPVTAGPYEKGVVAYTQKNYADALKHWQPLAERGNASAQNLLGFMYAKGHGVTQNNVFAYMWFSLSASRGQRSALKARARLARSMTPAQIAEAQKLAEECLRRKYKSC